MHPKDLPQASEKAKKRSLIVATVIATLVGWSILSAVFDDKDAGTSGEVTEVASRDQSWNDYSDVKTCSRQIALWGTKVIGFPGAVPNPQRVYDWFGPLSQESYGIQQGIQASLNPWDTQGAIRDSLFRFCDSYLDSSWNSGQMPALVAQDPCAYIPGDPACTENPMAQNLQACLAIPGRVLMEAPYCDPRLYYGS